MIQPSNAFFCHLFALDEGDSQAVGKPIGLLVDSEGDIPAIAEYANALKTGGGASPAAATDAGPESAAGGPSSMPESSATATGSVDEERVIEKFMHFCRVSLFFCFVVYYE